MLLQDANPTPFFGGFGLKCRHGFGTGARECMLVEDVAHAWEAIFRLTNSASGGVKALPRGYSVYCSEAGLMALG